MKRLHMSELWDSYSRSVLPANASTTQRWECRRAFYAGAQGFFHKVLLGLDPSKDPTAEDMALLSEVLDELTDFKERVKAGNA